MAEIRYVQQGDKESWFQMDRHLSEEEFDKKVRDKMGYVLLEGGVPIALLRYNLFWDNTPFCTLLFVGWGNQHKGHGRHLIGFWEKDMKERGYGMVMTSTQADEDAQHFYRKLGYQDAGALVVNIPGYAQPMELFFIKAV